MKKLPLLFIFLMAINYHTQAQLDSTRNLLNYTPAVLLQPQQFSYRFWNLLYTQKDLYVEDGTKFPARDRITFFTSQHQFAYGVNSTLNVEAEVWLKSVRVDLPENSPLQVYRFTGTDSARTALAYAAVGIRWRPNKKKPRLSLGSKILLPITQNLESQDIVQPFLAEDHFWWVNTLFYDAPIADNLYTFFEAGASISIPKSNSEQASIVRFPFRGRLSYFTSKVLSVNLQAGIALTSQAKINGYWGDLGLGLRWQIVPGVLELQGEYQKYVVGRNQGAGETFNFGLRWIRF